LEHLEGRQAARVALSGYTFHNLKGIRIWTGYGLDGFCFAGMQRGVNLDGWMTPHHFTSSKRVQLVVDHFLDYLSDEALDVISVSLFIGLHPVTRLA